MENLIKKNNTTMTTTIKDSIKDTLKELQTTMIKIVEEMIAQQMSIINLDMINTIKALVKCD